MDSTEPKRARGRPRKYFTVEKQEEAKKLHRANYRRKVRISSLNLRGDDLDTLRVLAARAGMTHMDYAGALIRKAKEDSDALS